MTSVPIPRLVSFAPESKVLVRLARKNHRCGQDGTAHLREKENDWNHTNAAVRIHSSGG